MYQKLLYRKHCEGLIRFAVPSQPSNLRASEVGETSVTLQWSRPTHAGENIVSYELYWNDTYAKVFYIY